MSTLTRHLSASSIRWLSGDLLVKVVVRKEGRVGDKRVGNQTRLTTGPDDCMWVAGQASYKHTTCACVCLVAGSTEHASSKGAAATWLDGLLPCGNVNLGLPGHLSFEGKPAIWIFG